MSKQTMLTDELATYLENAGIGTVGTDIFLGTLPQDIASGLYIVMAPSPPPHEYLDTEELVVDLWYRHDKTQLAYDKLRQIYNILHRRDNYSLGNWYVYFSSAGGQIMDFDRDEQNGKILRLSILFLCRNSNNVS